MERLSTGEIKYCLLTGASRGLGVALANRFWQAGYSLCLVARSHNDLERVKLSLPSKPGQFCNPLVCDLSNPEALTGLAEQIESECPSLCVMINNAAIHGPVGVSWQNDFAEWQRVVQVNLLAPVFLSRLAVTLMQGTGGGSIINLSGGGATSPRPNFSAYATAKSALVRFSETLAEETRKLGIRVNCIAPGAMPTTLLAEVLDKGEEAAGQREFEIACKVFDEGGASMDRVADLSLFLASNASNGITGKLISAVWDNWEEWLAHVDELETSDVYTLRRITGRDRGMDWGDK